MSNFVDYSGQKFGRLTVLSRAENKNGRTMFNCVCECGNKKAIWIESLKNGSTKSCGCLLHKKKYDEKTKKYFGRTGDYTIP